MHHVPFLRTLSLAALLAAYAAPSAAANAATEVAPADGWASRNGGTSGGSAAAATDTYLVSSPSALKAALTRSGTKAKIVKVSGTIDMASADNGGAFTSVADQTERNAITLPSNTTLIGVGSSAKLVNARVVLRKVSNVIVRNLTIVAPCDIAPVWDPNDGTGEWNALYDGIFITASKNVWIDHNHFTDAPLTDDKLPIANGKPKQCHDGAVDINSASDYVTVSYNVFDQHRKNTLIGSSDSATGDDGHLTVTLHHNHFSDVVERAPRVRFGRVHVYNNYYEGSRTDAVYPHQYSLGVGYKALILSEQNVFEIAGATGCTQVVKNPGSSSKTGAISDTGSLLNGKALNLASTCSFASASWTVPYTYGAAAASTVRKTVLERAGVGKLTVN